MLVYMVLKGVWRVVVYLQVYMYLSICTSGLVHRNKHFFRHETFDRIGWVSFNHSNGGQLLCAVGRDGNENMFPISIAVVDIECKSSWLWFLGLLFEDFGCPEETGWVFMSDKQKVHLLVLNFDC